MEIREIKSTEKDVVKKVADIHIDTFKGFFLTFMGRGFLNHMYRSYCNHNGSGLLVAFDGENPVGFLAYSENMSGLYKHMIKTRLVQFAWYSFGAFLRKPRIFMRLVRAFLKPSESKRKEEYVELSSLGVSPNTKRSGVGTALVDALKAKVDFDKFEYITLETDATNNDAANRFYLKNGFKRVREYETREHRRMFEYRFCFSVKASMDKVMH